MFTINDSVYRRDYLKIFTGYGNKQYAARRIAPPINVNGKWGKRPTITSDHMRVLSAKTDGRSQSMEVASGMSWSDYTCVQWDYHAKVYPSDEQQFGGEASATAFAMRVCAEAQLIDEEYVLATAMKTSGNFSGLTTSAYVTPTTAWSLASSDPVGDVATWAAIVASNGSRLPNAMAVTQDTHLVAAKIARESLSNGGYMGMPTEQQMAMFFGVDEYIVLTPQYVSTVEGQTNALAGIWGTKSVWLYYRSLSTSPEESMMEPCFARTIVDTLNTSNDREDIKDPLSKKYLVHSSYVNTPWTYACALWAHDVI
jgi:hypothetical protein